VFAQGFFSVHSPNGVDVWAVGKQGAIWRSYNGGVTWSATQQGAQDLRGVASVGTNVWIVGESGAAYRSTNAGGSWSPMTTGSMQSLRAVEFPTPLHGWIAGQTGLILRTTDGGTSWTGQTSGTTQHLNALAFLDSLVGYAAGDNGVLLKTINGGLTWTAVNDPSWRTHLTAVAVRGQTVYVTGLDAFCARSDNAGT